MNSLDYYAIEELLTDDERAARDRARRFVQEEAMPEIVPSHRAGKFPEKLIPRMGEAGFFAPYLKEHGCAGTSYTGFGLMMQELERGDSGLRANADRIRLDDAGAGTRRLGSAFARFGPGRARHPRDPFFRYGR